jgi:hypothetical protein
MRVVERDQHRPLEGALPEARRRWRARPPRAGRRARRRRRGTSSSAAAAQPSATATPGHTSPASTMPIRSASAGAPPIGGWLARQSERQLKQLGQRAGARRAGLAGAQLQDLEVGQLYAEAATAAPRSWLLPAPASPLSVTMAGWPPAARRTAWHDRLDLAVTPDDVGDGSRRGLAAQRVKAARGRRCGEVGEQVGAAGGAHHPLGVAGGGEEVVAIEADCSHSGGSVGAGRGRSPARCRR